MTLSHTLLFVSPQPLQGGVQRALFEETEEDVVCPGSPKSCTAGDCQLASATLNSGPTTCTVGGHITVEAS
jgi:hypothetical protein